MFAKRFLQKVTQHSSSTSSAPSQFSLPQTGNHVGVTQMDLDPHIVLHYGIPSTASMLTFDPIQRLLAIGTLDGRIKVIGGGNIEGILVSPKPLPYKSLEFLCNEGFLVSISNENEIQVWNLEHRQIATSLQWESNITAFSVVHGTYFMYIGDEYGSISVLKYSAKEEKLLQLPYHIPANSVIDAAGVSIDTYQSIVGVLPQPCTFGNRVLITYENGLIVLWDVYEARVILVRGYKDLQLKDGGTNDLPDDMSNRDQEDKEISSLCWAASDGSILAVGYVDGDIMLWNMSSSSSTKEQQDGTSSNNVVKLELSSGKIRLPVIVLHWSANSRSPGEHGGQLFIYGGEETGSEEVITVLSLDWSSGFETLKCFSRVDLTLNGSFADMMLISSSGTAGNDSNSSLFVLTNPGQLFVYDDVALSVLSSQQENKSSVPALKFPMTIPIFDPCMTVAKLSSIAVGGNSSKTLRQVASVMKTDAKTTLTVGTKWSLAGTVPSQSSFAEGNGVERLYMAGYQDGSVRIWDATCPFLSLMFVLEGKVENIEVTGVSTSVSALDFCSVTTSFAVGNEFGLVRIYKLSGSSDETSFHFVTDTKTEVHIIYQGIGPQCTAVFSVLNSPIQTLQFVNSGAKLAVGFECGWVAMLDMKSLSVLFLTDCVSGSNSPIISLTQRSFTDIRNLINSPKHQESRNAEELADVVFILTMHLHVVVLDSVTGNVISSQLLDHKESTAIALHIIESNISGSEISIGKTPEQLNQNQNSVTQHGSLQTIILDKSTQVAEMHKPSEITTSEDEPLQSLVLLCCKDALCLFSLKYVLQGHNNSIRKANLAIPCCWTTTFRKRDEEACGLVLLYQTGVIEIRSLPDLEVKGRISLTSVLRWSFMENMDKTTCSSDNGQISMVNGCELVFISLLASENDFSAPESMPCLHDKVLAAAADDAILLSYHQKKRQVSGPGILGGLIKGFKGEKAVNTMDFTERLSKSNFDVHLEGIFSKVPFSGPSETLIDNQEVVELNIDDIEIDEPVIVISNSSHKGKNDCRDKETEREKLFEGAVADTRPRLRTPEEIRAKYRKTGDVSTVVSQARDKLLQRQEKLEKISRRTEELQNGAESFASMANELVKTMESKKWWMF